MDEIGDVPMSMQVKLLRALQEQDPVISLVKYSFACDNLRDDPRYADLLKRIGAKSRSEEAQSKP